MVKKIDRINDQWNCSSSFNETLSKLDIKEANYNEIMIEKALRLLDSFMC